MEKWNPILRAFSVTLGRFKEERIQLLRVPETVLFQLLYLKLLVKLLHQVRQRTIESAIKIFLQEKRNQDITQKVTGKYERERRRALRQERKHQAVGS